MDADLAAKLQRRRTLSENMPADAPAAASAATQMKAEPRLNVSARVTPWSAAKPSSAETNPGSRRLPEKSNKPLQGPLWSPEKAVVNESRPEPRWSPVKSGDSAMGKVAHCEGSEACSRSTHSTKLPASPRSPHGLWTKCAPAVLHQRECEPCRASKVEVWLEGSARIESIPISEIDASGFERKVRHLFNIFEPLQFFSLSQQGNRVMFPFDGARRIIIRRMASVIEHRTGRAEDQTPLTTSLTASYRSAWIEQRRLTVQTLMSGS